VKKISFGGKNEKQTNPYGGGVLTSLLFTLLFSLASCDNGSTTSPSEKNSEIVATYGLSGDKIFLYDDMTFIISLKDNAGTISGTYANASDYMTLLVGKKSGNVADVGNILKLKVADDRIEVISSDIDRYAEGEKGEQTGGTQNPGDISNPSETKPIVVATYGLKGDEISLYNDKTFTISLKDSTSKILGLYASVSGYMTLLVDKESVNLAKSGDVLKLKVAEDGKIEVISSDIDRYAEGEKGEQTGGTQNPGDADDPLGEPPAENLRLPKDYYSAIPRDDGIYFEFSVPKGARGGNACTVSIAGIGQVAEVIALNEKGNKGTFFYPFVKPSTKYTVRFRFPREEDTDDEGFVINYISDGTVGWFETTAIAGKNSLGEVKLTETGEIEVQDNGDFRFTKRPTFEGEQLLTGNDYDWTEAVCPVEGVSWLEEGRKTKWGGEILIPQKLLEQKHNLYTSDYNGWKGDLKSINFLCIRPKMNKYTYDGIDYTYQWDNFLYKTPNLTSEAQLWTEIDMNNPADVNKIVGTWKYSNEWEDWYDDKKTLKVKAVWEENLGIESKNVTETDIWTYTKPNGSAFTDDEIKTHFCYTRFSDSLPENEDEYFVYEEGTFSDGSNLGGSAGNDNTPDSDDKDNAYDSDDIIEQSESKTTYKYKIYVLHNNYSISSDKKTITETNSRNASISEYFADYSDYYKNYTRHYTVKLFEDGNTLRIVRSGTDDGEPYEWYRDYKKQN